MPLDPSGKPLRCYTNQSESINNKLTRVKEAVMKNDKGKVNMTKTEFTMEVWENVDNYQQEMKLAMCGLSEIYELADVVAYLKLTPEEWFDMNEHERSDFVDKFNKLTVEDVSRGRTIQTKVLDNPCTDYEDFSEDAKLILQSSGNWTDGVCFLRT